MWMSDVWMSDVWMSEVGEVARYKSQATIVQTKS